MLRSNHSRTRNAAGILLLLALLFAPGWSGARTNTAQAAPAPQSANPGVLAAFQGTLVDVYAAVNPSVVHIRTEARGTGMSFFVPELRQGSGSGFIWDREGHIVTNNHVIANATRIAVNFHDGLIVPAVVVGVDPASDLAVLRVDVPTERLLPVTLADSTQINVGQMAIAIGNPFGFQGSMTVGVISALGRLLPVQSETLPGGVYSIPEVIQTDAAINPGNSGGVLVNGQAQVLGVTSALFSPDGLSAGIGFAIPSSMVRNIVPRLIADGFYAHPWLGVSSGPLTPDIAAQLGLNPTQRGTLIFDVVPGSPAAQAGLRAADMRATRNGDFSVSNGDVIVAIDGQPVTFFEDLLIYMERFTRVGQEVTLTVLRNGLPQDIPLTLTARPGTGRADVSQDDADEANSADTENRVGLVTSPLTMELAEAMGLSPAQRGLLVVQVEPDSPADAAGLRGSNQPAVVAGRQTLVGGDIIIAANGRDVGETHDLVEAFEAAPPEQPIDLTILRNGTPQQVTLAF